MDLGRSGSKIVFDQSRRGGDSEQLDLTIPGKVKFLRGRQSPDGLIRFTDGTVLSSQSAAGEPVLIRLLDSIRSENRKVEYLEEVFENARRRFAQLEAQMGNQVSKQTGYEEFGPVFGPGGEFLAKRTVCTQINLHIRQNQSVLSLFGSLF